MELRFGLVGAGAIGAIRAQALEASPDCQLVAIADLDQIRAHKVAQGTKARVYADYAEMFASSEVDAVLVCAPPHLHETITLQAFDRGKHVLCEKPLSNSVESCVRMVRAAREKKLTLATGFNHRYFAAVRLVKTAIESGEIGDLDHVRAFAGHVGVSELQGSPWLLDPKVMGGGALMDNGIHLIDMTRHVLGEVRSVMGAYSDGVWNIPGAEGNGFALLRSTEDHTATLQASWTEWRGYRFYIAAYGSRGTAWGYYAPMAGMVVTMDRPGGKPHRRYELFPKLNLRERLKGWQLNVVDTFVLEFRDFKALVEGDQRTIAEGFDGLRAVEIAQAVRRSFDEKRAIDLIEPF